ncbi:MAG: isoprenylcysteine carboxylmethyltransferase family protein [Myxococcota bacterium]|nr:isoprenylcysteine carboxylmethyltransferase family protein [Myxococcota bacterium]
MTQLVFWIVVGSAVVAIAGVLLSWGRPAARIWPPPRGGSWQALASWLFIEVTMLGPLLLGILDWNGWVVPTGLRAVAGGILVPAGFGVGLAAMRQLTVAASFGMQGRLLTSGLYRYSRNPQCVGFIAGYLGFALLCSSLLAFVTAVLLSVELGLSPFAEEPWLRERFGQAYRDYARRVPRFLGRPA